MIDPLDEENPATKGRGTRITISEKETALADFIVGNKVEGEDDKRYVRKFGEDKVYRVSARFDVSTKFSDWAETDLLKVTGFDIVRLRGSRPKINDADEYEGYEDDSAEEEEEEEDGEYEYEEEEVDENDSELADSSDEEETDEEETDELESELEDYEESDEEEYEYEEEEENDSEEVEDEEELWDSEETEPSSKTHRRFAEGA